MAILTPEQVSNELAELHACAFGGKTRGRFSLSHDELRALSGRTRLEKGIIEQIGNWLLSGHQLALVDCGPAFGVIDAMKVISWRPVPKKLLDRGD